LLIFLWPLVFKTYDFLGIVFLSLAVKTIFSGLKTNLRSISLCLGAVFCASFFIIQNWEIVGRNVYTQRNYYGINKVFIGPGDVLELDNGKTLHGLEYLFKEKANEPLAYYHKNTPLGKILESSDFVFQHVGVIGLGAGTVAAYGKKDEVIDFFELDKDVYWIAAHLFNYLKDTKATTNFILGDARVSIKASNVKTYDLLIVDAFSGDYVPVHLLTTNAILEYKKHLKKNGIILFHISNQFLDLAPILFSNASIVHAYSMVSINYSNDPLVLYLSSAWVALTWEKDRKNLLVSKLGWKEDGSNNSYVKKVRPWTDDYTNLLPVIKIDYLINQVKFFTPFYWDWKIKRWQ
jgi:spermidine synthase